MTLLVIIQIILQQKGRKNNIGKKTIRKKRYFIDQETRNEKDKNIHNKVEDTKNDNSTKNVISGEWKIIRLKLITYENRDNWRSCKYWLINDVFKFKLIKTNFQNNYFLNTHDT